MPDVGGAIADFDKRYADGIQSCDLIVIVKDYASRRGWMPTRGQRQLSWDVFISRRGRVGLGVIRFGAPEPFAGNRCLGIVGFGGEHGVRGHGYERDQHYGGRRNGCHGGQSRYGTHERYSNGRKQNT